MPAGSHTFQVGSIRCTVLSDGYVSNPAGWVFPNADRDELGRALESRRLPIETIISPYTCLLVETGRHVLLVDTGMGPSGRTSGAILARLQMAGIRPGDVDTVVLTHAHPDHLGGAVDFRTGRTPRPMFPNARYVMSEREWDFWTAARIDLSGLCVPEGARNAMESVARRCLPALRHQVELIEGETEILPEVRAIPAPGHTPGHLALLLASGGEQLLNLGDAVFHPLHLEHPQWNCGFDSAADCAAVTRGALLQRAAAENMQLMAFHFPFPSVGRLAARQDGSWEWTPGC